MQPFTGDWPQRTEFAVRFSLSHSREGVRKNWHEHITHLKKASRTCNLWSLEYWRIGALGKSPTLHYSNTPANDAVNSFP
jgi:hypothetical protein